MASDLLLIPLRVERVSLLCENTECAGALIESCWQEVEVVRVRLKWFILLAISLNLSAKEVGSGASKRVQQLNYPALAQETLDRIQKKKKADPGPLQLDSMLSQDWGLAHIGFFESFTPLVQPLKTSTELCSSDVVVAVVDTGIDYTHPDLKDNLWVNAGEIPENGIDDDGNGFIDDVVGWDFVHEVPLPYDTHGHGSHIAGIISSSAANGVGVSGVCPRVSVMALKYYDNSGIGYNNLQNTVRAIQYAVKMGAHIINYSGGGSDPAVNERLAVEEAKKQGVLFVAAAGNDGHNNDLQPYYPASYGLDNIVSVASITKQNQLLPSSNFGKSVQIAAPGLNILSALPGNRFGTMSGTSQATAFVTGAAALLASQWKDKKQIDYHIVKKWLEEGAVPIKGNDSRTLVSSGMLSIPGALKAAVSGLKKRLEPPALALTAETPSKKKTQ